MCLCIIRIQVMIMSMLQIEISFCLIFAITGVYFRGRLNYLGDVGRQKIKSEPNRARKSWISIFNFNCMPWMGIYWQGKRLYSDVFYAVTVKS